MVRVQYRLEMIIITMYLSLAMQEKTVVFSFWDRTPERLPVVKEIDHIHAPYRLQVDSMGFKNEPVKLRSRNDNDKNRGGS